jgi:hypothetical protein
MADHARKGPADYRALELEQLRASCVEADSAVQRADIDVRGAAAIRSTVEARLTAVTALKAALEHQLREAADVEASMDARRGVAQAHAAKQRELFVLSEAKMASFTAAAGASHGSKAQTDRSEVQPHDGDVANADDVAANQEVTPRQAPPAPLPSHVFGPAWIGHAPAPWTRHRGDFPRLPTHPTRTVYGVGTTFTEYVTRHNAAVERRGDAVADRGWTLVGEPEEASVVWMRDHLVGFERDRWDPLTQQLNRANVRLEQALGNKANLARAMEAFYRKQQHPEPRFTPVTFPFGSPKDFIAFLTAAQQPATRQILQRNVWILKRADLASGFGIELVPNALAWFDKEKMSLMNDVKQGRSFVLQQYIRRPRLIDKRKFDYRLYVCFTAMYEPVRALAADGYVRMSVQPYEDADYANQRIHVSNVAAGRTSEDYTRFGYDFFVRPMAQPTPDPLDPSKTLTLPSAFADWRDIRAKVDEAVSHVVRAVILGQGLDNRSELWEPTDVFASQLYGFDFTIDDDGHPWLTEVQVCPALGIERDAQSIFMETLEVLYERLAKRMHGGESLDVFNAELRRLKPIRLS